MTRSWHGNTFQIAFHEGNPAVTAGFPSQHSYRSVMWSFGILFVCNVTVMMIMYYSMIIIGQKVRELLNPRTLQISKLYTNLIFQCMCKIFCVEFQRDLWNSKQNILHIHWKKCSSSRRENIRAHRFISLQMRTTTTPTPDLPITTTTTMDVYGCEHLGGRSVDGHMNVHNRQFLYW